MKICVRPEAGSRENRARDIAAADGMMARESHATPLLCREVVRENRVNQSGSVALSTEAMRGPPWRNLLIIMALLTQQSGYEPAGRLARHANRSIARRVSRMDRKTRASSAGYLSQHWQNAGIGDGYLYTKT